MDRAAASPEHTEQLCWSTCRSSSLGADTGAPLEHIEQWLPWSTESRSAGARRSAALWEQIQVLQWNIMEQQLPWRTESSCIGARGAAAIWEHTEQLCLYTCSSGATESAPREPLLHVLQHTSCFLCSREAVAPSAPVEQLYLLLESCCSTYSNRAALCAPGKLLLHNAPLEHLYLLPESL